MSRVGKQSISIPSNVTVSIDGSLFKAKGPKGELVETIPSHVSVSNDGGEVVVKRLDDTRKSRAMHGLCRALLNNVVKGVSEGFKRELEINGVGYRAEAGKGYLSLVLGYSHPIEVLLPDGISASVKKNVITLEGCSKVLLGETAAVIRKQRGPEPYKGKGVKYVDEHIRRKAGKTGAT